MQTLAKFTINSKEYTAVLMEGTTPFADAATKTLYDAILAKIHVGDTINVKGVICGSSFIVTAVDDVTFVKASELTDAEKAQKALDSAKKKFAESYKANTTITLSDGITAVVKSGSTAKVENGKVVITPTDEEVEVVVTLTATSGSESKSEDVTFKTKLPEPIIVPEDALSQKVDYKAPASDVKGVAWGTSVIEYFDFPAGIIADVVINQGTSTNANFNIGHEALRVYKGGQLVLTAAEGHEIYKVEFTFESTSKDKNPVVEVSDDKKTITVTAANAQVKISSITIYYK